MKNIKITGIILSAIIFLFSSLHAQISYLPITDFELTDTVWEYQRDGIVLAKIRLKNGGKIDGYQGIDEAKWSIEDKDLVFYNTKGDVTIKFSSFDKKGGRWTITGKSQTTGSSYVLKESSGAVGPIKKAEKQDKPAQNIQPYISAPLDVLARTIKPSFSVNEPITIEYFNLPGYNQDWITIVSAGSPDNKYGEWFYTGGKKNGSYTFSNPGAGSYELRVYFNWPDGGYRVMSRYLFTVTAHISPYQSSITWDFETGDLRGWTTTGDAFSYQPTYGDNPTARHRGQPSNHQGNYWIGGYEKRNSPYDPPGQIQGDGPQGTMTSKPFNISTTYISFLIGGGCDIKTVRAELLVDGYPVMSATGNCNETMNRIRWNVSAYMGRTAQIRLIDHSSGGWGHINFDDVKFEN